MSQIKIKNTSKEKMIPELVEMGFIKRVSENIFKYNIEIIDDSKGATYMSEFMDDFPKNVLLDKGKTGIGATTMALKHKDKFVIAVPFKDLASNKKEWCKINNVNVLVVNGDTPNDDIKEFKGNKVIVVYDSLYKISANLPEFNSFRIMIDEAHILLTSGTFRKRAIYTVFREYKKYKNFVFLTATIPSRMYDMSPFRNMDKVIIKWKNNLQPTFLSHIIDPYSIESLSDVLYTICIEHLKGKRSSNAYIFINSVRAIKHLVRLLINKEKLTHSDINIIAASSNESDIENYLGEEFTIGKPPKSTESAKKLNFITSTGFEGQDFYDSNGKVYIVSDGSYEFMKLDLLTQVPQIVGRLRDSDLNNEIPIILVPNKVEENQTFEMFRKNLKTELTIAKNNINERYRLLNITRDRFDGADKTSIENFEKFKREVKDKSEYYVSGETVSINKLYYLNNLNKWDVKQQGVLAVYNEEFGLLEAKYSELFEMSFKNEPVHNMPIEFIKYRKDIQQPMKTLILKSFDLLKEWCDSEARAKSMNKSDIKPEFYAFYTPDWIKDAYFTIGEDRIKRLRYSKSAIEQETACYPLHKLIPNELKLEIGIWYSNEDLKERIQGAYDSLKIIDGVTGNTKVAKAINIKDYYTANRQQKKRKWGYLIVSKITL